MFWFRICDDVVNVEAYLKRNVDMRKKFRVLIILAAVETFFLRKWILFLEILSLN